MTSNTNTEPALIIHPDRTQELKRVPTDLRSLQEIVGGYLELVVAPRLRALCVLDNDDAPSVLPEQLIALVDEDGRSKLLPFNPLASAVLGREVCGKVIFLLAGSVR